MNDWLEYVAFAKADALKPAPCPRCQDAWFEMTDETGRPYSCYCCFEGGYKWIKYEAEEYLLQD